ncbi:GDP-mannose transporter [Trypanosoma rangeli]|uniref:GDP-mannose transporter n=1 Tax=Trypanosoma rangeli TaxID=5698 RepID=A0A422N243_TRYRA|nr:GDP-mannose transporter [Trypanosoma rangeli]RNE99537.1 GDP-mannose transporter [Trypanosoma rangeli]|eukprot:RNE99537.1 GDP-mannose transporter [Trypanosoma rangeli]
MKRVEKGGKTAEVLASILAYSICSMSMIILNKLVMFTYGLNFPMGLLFIQNSGAVLLVSFGKYMRWIHYPDFSMEVTKKWLPLTFLFVAMLWTSMKSLHTMSVSMQTIIKNLAVIFTAFGDSKFFNKHVTPPMYFSFCLMFFGSYLGAKGDQWVTSWGVFWTCANIVSTVSYTLYMKLLLGDVSAQIGRYGPVFYNNLLSLPFILAALITSLPDMLTGLSNAPFDAVFALILMVFAGSVMTFAVFWCMKETSPTTFSVIGAVNKAPLAIMGMIVFNQFPTLTGYVGIFLALSGGFIYTYTNVFNNAKAQERGPGIGPSCTIHQELGNEAASSTEKLKNVL